jgi:muconolactone D-isomerase
VEFLTHITVEFPPGMAPEEVASVREAERRHSAELAKSGIQRRLWRQPARSAVWALWEVDDATALHETITALPQFPYMTVDVFPLADHPADPGRAAG